MPALRVDTEMAAEPTSPDSGPTATPASTKLARSLSSNLDAAMHMGQAKPSTPSFLSPPVLRTTGSAKSAFGFAEAEARTRNDQAVKNASAAGYDYCGGNVQEILAERDGADGEEELLVSWLGRCVPDRWVERSFLEVDYVSRGLLAAHDEAMEYEAEKEAEDAFSVDESDLDDALSITSSTGAAVDRVLTAFEDGDVAFSQSGSSAADLGEFDLVDEAENNEHESDGAPPPSPAPPESPGDGELARQLSLPMPPRSPGGSVSFASLPNASDPTLAQSSHGRSRTRRRRRKGGKNDSGRKGRIGPVGGEEIELDQLPPDVRPYWSAFQSAYVRGGLPFERVARQLSGPSGRGRGPDGTSLVTAGGVARMLCRLGMLGSHAAGDLSSSSSERAPAKSWSSLSPAKRAEAIAEGKELLYETAELGLCLENLNGKEMDRVITLSSLSLALLYYRITHDPTDLEPRRLFTIVEFLLFAHPGQSVSQSPIIMATAAFHLLTSRYDGEIRNIPRRMYAHVEKKERYGGSFSFLQWLNSPLPLLPPQWTVL